MTNCYETPEFVELGKAQAVILGEKIPATQVDSFGCLCTENPITDDFDE